MSVNSRKPKIALSNDKERALSGKKAIIHPFLFAVFPVLFFYSHNIAELSFDYSILIWLGISATFALVLFLFFKILFKENLKAGLITTIFLICFFSYGHIYLALSRLPIGRHRYLISVYGFCVATALYFTLRRFRDVVLINRLMNFVGAFLALIPIFQIAIIETKAFVLNANNPFPDRSVDLPVGADKSNLPDIYYIILDRYASPGTLKDIYDFDNGRIVDFLRSKGFFVATKSFSNYGETSLSLASSLNMDYVGRLGISIEGAFYTQMRSLLTNNKVSTILKSNGYKYLHLGSWYGSTSHNENADTNFQFGYLNEFSAGFFRTTMLVIFDDFIMGEDYRLKIAGAFSKLAQVCDVGGPKYVFAHIICPHGPYVFGPGGEKRTISYDEDKDREGYLDAITFVNSQIKVLVQELLSKSRIRPVIIIQADHGPGATKMRGALSEPFVREKLGIFNAYFFPDGNYDGLYTSISPVNSFRIIFNKYLNAGFELLSDEHYLPKSFDRRDYLRLLNVSKKLVDLDK